MEILIKAAQLILSLSLLVILHEFGHFIPAKIFKTRVEKFYLFFNPWFALFKKKIGDTEWGIGWLPLGGFVKIAGMVDESMDKEQLALPPQPWEFRSKPAWQRLIIMLGGVTVNVIAAIIIYVGIVLAYGEEQLKPQDIKHGLSIHPFLEQYGLKSGDNIVAVEGEPINSPLVINSEILLRGKRSFTVIHEDGKKSIVTLPKDVDYKMFESGAYQAIDLRSTNTTVDSVIPKKAADFAKIKKGDKILSVNTVQCEYYDNLKSELYKARSKKANISLLRGKDTLNLTANVAKEGTLGFVIQINEGDRIDESKVKVNYFGLGESIGKGIKKGYYTLNDYIAQMKFIFTKKGSTEISGFAGIGKMFPSVWNWQIFWLNTAFISIALAFMNILPIPALDGGHVVFLLYEIITGKEAPQKVLEYAQYVGFFLLIGLTLYANGLDVFKWLTGS